MTALLDAALRYAEFGYAVFPCANGLKPAPLTKRGFKDASTDPKQIEAWWKQHPTACIGMSTEGLLVIDVDGPKNRWLTNDRADELSNASAARTPRGGWHFVFRRSSGVEWRCSVGRVAPQVDVRTDGGYIVVSPSRRTDGDYQWVEGRELNVGQDQLPEPPHWLAEALDDLTKPSVKVNAKSKATQSSPQNANSRIVGVIPNGQRNATLAQLAGSMRRVGLSESEIGGQILVEVFLFSYFRTN